MWIDKKGGKRTLEREYLFLGLANVGEDDPRASYHGSCKKFNWNPDTFRAADVVLFAAYSQQLNNVRKL